MYSHNSLSPCLLTGNSLGPAYPTTQAGQSGQGPQELPIRWGAAQMYLPMEHATARYIQKGLAFP